MAAIKSPRCNSNDDVSVVGEGSTRVSLTGVLAAHIQDPGAHHAFVNVWPILVTRLSLEVSVTSCTLFLVDDVHVDMQQLLRMRAVSLQYSKNIQLTVFRYLHIYGLIIIARTMKQNECQRTH